MNVSPISKLAISDAAVGLHQLTPKVVANRWCQLADFRERGGLSFELRAVASESDSPSDAHDAHNFHTHNTLLASARTPLRFNHKQLKPTPVIRAFNNYARNYALIHI